jgi:hypothetical protein
MEENNSSKDKKTDLLIGRVIAGVFALLAFYMVYKQADFGNQNNNQTTRILFSFITAFLVVLAYAFIELLLNLWQKTISQLLIFFDKYPLVRPWVVVPIIVASVLSPFYSLRYWKIENTLIVLMILYLVFLLPAALTSLLREDRRFEKTALGKIISRNIQAQNPQAAIEHAFTVFEDHLRGRIPNGAKLYSNGLIGAAYGGQKSKLVYIVDEKDQTTHLYKLISGAYSLFRNPRHHKIVQDEPYTAQTLIPFIELLMQFVDESEEREKIYLPELR